MRAMDQARGSLADTALGGVPEAGVELASGKVGPGEVQPVDPRDDRGDVDGFSFTSRHTRRWAISFGVAVVAAGLLLRFWTRSDLWLDEALTVDIARQPLSQLQHLLREDGAPPLYYALLHFWMGVFGQSDLAVRALSGVIGVATLPVVWLGGNRVGGRWVAWTAVLLVASSPFAVRYDTETRMYALVALLTACGFLALCRALKGPRPGNLVAVAAVTALLLYSHYWSVYLLAMTGLWLLFSWWRGPPERRRPAFSALVAMAVGVVLWLPWFPTFLFQSQHTGTPWAVPANFAALVNTVATFAGGTSSQGRALALIFFGLGGLGLFGAATDRFHVSLDLRGRPWGRPLAAVVFGTLALAVIGGYSSHSAFDVRYASVIFVPLVLLVSLGTTCFADHRLRVAVVTFATLAGLAGAIPNVTTNRTQAGQVAAAISRVGQPGDVVAYCPDQLGPAVYRLLPNGYRQVTFPRRTGPEFVNWIDYGAASEQANPVAFAHYLQKLALSAHGTIYYVWAPGYQTFHTECETIYYTLESTPGYKASELVGLNSVSFFQPMNLTRIAPVTP